MDDGFSLISHGNIDYPILIDCIVCGDIYKFGSYNKDPKSKCKRCKNQRLIYLGDLERSLDLIEKYPEYFEGNNDDMVSYTERLEAKITKLKMLMKNNI